MYILTGQERQLFISINIRMISLFKDGKCHGKDKPETENQKG